MRYIKKPVVIEAFQALTRDDMSDISQWIRRGGGECSNREIDNAIVITTLEGEMLVGYGDWVIRGVKGEFYPCKPDIFEATYEQVSE